MRASESILSDKKEERRRSERKPHTVEAYIISPTATDQTDRMEVTSVNLSRHGVAFDFTEPLAKKTYWTIEIDMGSAAGHRDPHHRLPGDRERHLSDRR
jgi:hypothetical protein